jgi:hypothetical protein
MHGGKFALIGLSGNIRIGSFLVAAGHCSFNSLSLLGVHKVGEFPIGINVRRGPRLLMNVDDRMGSCRDKGRGRLMPKLEHKIKSAQSLPCA